MLRVQPIATLDAPELAPYRTLRRQLEHRAQGIFVAEGEKVVRRLLESSLPVVSLLLPAKWLGEYETLCAARPEEIDVYVAEKALLETLTGFSMYQGVLAMGRVPPEPGLEGILKTERRPWLFVAADGLSNAENLGALVRNCGAFGVQGLLVSGTSASPFLRRAVRSSMGVIFRLPVVEGLQLPEALDRLRAAGVRCVAAHPRTNQRFLTQADFTGDCCIVFGSEGAGLSPEVLAACDEAAAIPMAAGVDSVNVGSAAAVFLYEARRQRGEPPGLSAAKLLSK
jgi:tRNA G18 (ribose-2'-O)-methylase SpoU